MHYISHHEVLKQDSASTPCRIVFNASANYKNHVLNDYWAKSPDLLGNLLGILVKFREDHVAYIGDIRKMYHTIRMELEDQHTHRFIWRDYRLKDEPDENMMQVVSFGDRPAATIAQLALRRTAELASDDYKGEKLVIQKSTYMDDIIDSVETLNIAKTRTTNLETILAAGSFKIKKWIFSGGKGTEVCLANTEESEKVLGLTWSLEKDVFEFKSKVLIKTKVSTKQYTNLNDLRADPPASLTRRQALSQLNSIFDPLGLATPFTVKAKVLMRRTWEANRADDWDESLPPSLLAEWITIFEELFEMKNVSFPRCIKPKNAVGNPQLVVFSDASKEAFGACAYAVWELEDGSHASNLILAKSRLAPKRQISIVRLELCGLLLAVRIKCFLFEHSRLNFDSVKFIVDSEIVRAMTQKESYGFNIFTGLRLGEIQETENPKDFFWVPGDLNIADLISRGSSPAELKLGSKWQSGPSFLQLEKQHWPLQQKQYSMSDLPDVLKSKTFSIQEKHSETIDYEIDRFRSLASLIRTIARILLLKTRRSLKVLAQMLTLKEIEEAWNFIVKHEQKELQQF